MEREKIHFGSQNLIAIAINYPGGNVITSGLKL